MKPYVFLNTEIKDLNQLADLYTSNFKEAINDVFDNTKALLNLIKKLGGKELSRKIASEIVNCRYKNNVITFIIFYLSNDKRVVINGNVLSFKDFILLFKSSKNKENALYAFIKDLGLSKTYGTMNIDKFLGTDAFYLEKSIDDDFTYEYLSNYYSYGYSETLKTKISNVFIYDEEQFRRAAKIANDFNFNLQLAHSVGFKSVYKMRCDKQPLFECLKLLYADKKEEFSPTDLLGVVTNKTFFWWLFDNFDKYDYKKNAKKLYKELLVEKKIYNEEYNDFDFNNKIDMSMRLYIIYLKFVQYFKLGLVSVKSKYESDLYSFDKKYCRTLVTTDYMKNNPIKLSTRDDEIEEELLIDINRDLTAKYLIKQNKLHKALASFSTIAIVSIFILIALFIISFITIKFKNFDYRNKVFEITLLGIVSLLSFVFFIILNRKSNKTLDAISKYKYIEAIENEGVNHTPSEELKCIELANSIDDIKNIICKKYYVVSFICSILFGAISVLISIFCLNILACLNVLNVNYDRYYLFMIPGVMLGLIAGVFKKKGVLTALFTFVITILLVILLAVI